MPFTPMTGINGAVRTSGSSYAFAKWKADMRANLPKVNNFTSSYQQLVAGMKSATVTLTGPYDQGNMPFTAGASYIFILDWNGSISLTITVLLESIGASQDVEDAGRVELVGQSNGSFTAAIA